jgi:centrosomal protein CEP41
VQKVKFVTAKEYSKRREEIFFRLTASQLYDLFSEYEADEYESISEAGKSGDDLKIVTHAQNDTPINRKPYLILDVREPDYYNTCHILQARSFPYVYLRRDQLHPEVYNFRNKPETLIIIYCEDEKISRDAAKVLVDRGTDNIFLLTGGLIEFASNYPAFVEGIPPSPLGKVVKNTSTNSTSNDTYLFF